MKIKAAHVLVGLGIAGLAAYLIWKYVIPAAAAAPPPPAPPPSADSIEYIEHWVGGKQVTTVRKGDQLEVRVVFTVASPGGGTIRLAIQRVPGGAYVPSGDMTRVPGTYYMAWSWTVDYTGSYAIKVDLFNDGTLVQTKSFPHTVT